jgi:hypothetical protein
VATDGMPTLADGMSKTLGSSLSVVMDEYGVGVAVGAAPSAVPVVSRLRLWPPRCERECKCECFVFVVASVVVVVASCVVARHSAAACCDACSSRAPPPPRMCVWLRLRVLVRVCLCVLLLLGLHITYIPAVAASDASCRAESPAPRHASGDAHRHLSGHTVGQGGWRAVQGPQQWVLGRATAASTEAPTPQD